MHAEGLVGTSTAFLSQGCRQLMHVMCQDKQSIHMSFLQLNPSDQSINFGAQ